MGLRNWIVSLVLVIMFSLFILSFAGNFIQTTNPSSEVLSAKYGLSNSIKSMNDSITGFSNVANSVYGQLGESQPSAADYLFLIFKGAFYIPYTFLSFAFSGLNSLVLIIFPSLTGTGLGNIISLTLGVIFSVLLITIVLLIVRAIRTGQE